MAHSHSFDRIVAVLAVRPRGIPNVIERVSWSVQFPSDVHQLAAQFGNIGLIAVQFLLTVAIAGVMYAGGEAAADGVRRFMRRLAAEQGDIVVTLAAQAIRGVALGVVVTAIIQSLLGGVGLAVAGVPFAGILTAVMFMSCIAQIGPVIILAPAVAWLYWTGATGWGTGLLIWTIFVGTIDNFLRPILIRQGADLPLLLIFAGVIGGLITLGLVGIFVGPVVLAITYTQLSAWVAEQTETPEAATAMPVDPEWAATAALGPPHR